MSEGPEIRKFICSCFCEFYMPVGIEPSFCPHCSGEIVKVLELPEDGCIGMYTEGNDEKEGDDL